MLERIALHQTRLRVPGLGLDSKGVALGQRGLILLPSIDRVVALLGVYTRERSLEDLTPSLEIHSVRSKLGAREFTLQFAADSSDRMDRLAETARLVGGFTFTGTSRHFVQYRDAGAPFGYDVAELLASDAALALYHDKFTQLYDLERAIELRALLLRLTPHVDPATFADSGARIIVAEQGLGPALVRYLVRSRVDGEVAVAEWPPETAFDDGVVRRTIVRVPDLPTRMRPLMQTTPGLTTFLPAGPGVAVEIGYRHPVHLRGCNVFDPSGLVLLRGRGDEPWTLPRMPVLGDLKAFARVELRGSDSEKIAVATCVPQTVRVPLRIVPSPATWSNVTATWLQPAEIPKLRALAYLLPRDVLSRTTVAITGRGVFLRCTGGIESVPIGMFFSEPHPNLFLPAGYELSPAVSSEVLFHALGSPPGQLVFVTPECKAIAVEQSAFVPLETVLLEAMPWEPAVAEQVERALCADRIDLKLAGLGLFPLGDVESPE